MKQLSQLKDMLEFAPVFAVLDATLLDLANQQFLTDTQNLINNTGFGPVYGLYYQEINHIMFSLEGVQMQTDEDKPSFTCFCEQGLALSLGSVIHLISWDSLTGHQFLPVNVDENPVPNLMVKIDVANNEMISQIILPDVKVFLMIDTIMRGFAKIANIQQ